MRVKIGNTWHEVTADTPIALELTNKDRRSIQNMSPDATRISWHHDDENTTPTQKLKWLRDGDES